jgi:FAD/FMN-containing dehydrogenase
VATALVAVADFQRALRLLDLVDRAAPGRVMVFEGMWREMIEIATGPIGVRAPFNTQHELCVLVELLGQDAANTEAMEGVLATALERDLIVDAVIAKSEADRARLWALRESPYEYARLMPKMVGFDISVPLNRVAEAVARLRAELPAAFAGARVVVFGHIADSNLHVIVIPPEWSPALKSGIERAVYRITADFGGSVSAEHGIGAVKKPYLPLSRGPAELALMGAIKAAFDPHGILNRGRILQTAPPTP